MGACIAGEFLGIGAAALTAVFTFIWMGEPETLDEKLLGLTLILIAGTLEGFLLGGFQWLVLKNYFPKIPAREWIGMTTLVAVLGWVLGMIPSTFFPTESVGAESTPPTEPSAALVLGGALLLGMVMGTGFGWFQWQVFRKYAVQTKPWIWANMWGWGVAMVCIFIGATLPNESTPLPIVVLSGAIGGIFSGLSLGIITGFRLNKIIEQNQEVGQTH